MERPQIQSELKTLISNLVKQDFDVMDVQGLFGISSSGQVEHVINSYPGEMTYPPEHKFDCFELYGNPNGDFTIDFALWFNGK